MLRDPTYLPRRPIGSTGRAPFPAVSPRIAAPAAGRRGQPALSAGFTLIEMLVAVVIVSVGVVAVLRTFGSCMDALSDARDVLRASLIVRNKFAEARRAALGGEAELVSLGGRFVADERYRGRMRIDLESRYSASTGEGKDPGQLYRVGVAVWRQDTDFVHGATAYVRVPP